MNNNNYDAFDFEKLKNLYKSDPEQFEKVRAKLIESAITHKTKDLRKLKGLQFRIDCIVKTAKNPLEACIKLFGEMSDSVLALKQAIENGNISHQELRAPNIAAVLPFAPKKNNKPADPA